jgi:hypothetical protein
MTTEPIQNVSLEKSSCPLQKNTATINLNQANQDEELFQAWAIAIFLGPAGRNPTEDETRKILQIPLGIRMF